MDNIISFAKIKKSFGSQCVLDELSFEVKKGAITYIIGRSGEGKSVTMKHIAGTMKPDSGEIYFDGQPMAKARQEDWVTARKKMGVLFQDGALFDSLSVFENIAFPIVEHSRMNQREIKKRVEKLLELVGLKKGNNVYPAELSIGEKKRVGLARALALEPDVLLYDEPTTSMDPLISDLIDNLIVNFQKENLNLTSIVISHDIKSILSVSDHILFLHEGKIYKSGTAEDFLSSDDPIVQQFITGSRDGPLARPIG